MKVKNSLELGAAFTKLEADLAAMQAGLEGATPEERAARIGRDLVFGTTPGERARLGKQRAMEDAVLYLSDKGAAFSWMDHRTLTPALKEKLSQNNITWDTKTGKPTIKDAIGERVAQLSRSTSNREGMGQAQAPAKSLGDVMKESYPDITKASEDEKVNALVALKKLGYPQEQIIPLLGIKDGGK